MSIWRDPEYTHLPLTERYTQLAKDLDALLSVDEPLITLYSNAAAFLYATLDRVNWAGFYLYDGHQLVLGPFVGKPACTTIGMGKGVCGTAATKEETIVVDDVDQFPGHIACDDGSRSEIVLPLIMSDGRLLGVLDIDSTDLARFTHEDRNGLEAIREVLITKIEKNQYTSPLLAPPPF